MWKRPAGVGWRAVEAEVMVAWRGETLALRRARDGERVTLGDVPGALVPIPCGVLELEGFELVRVDAGEVTVFVPAQARARMERPDGTTELLPGPRELCLLEGDVVRLGIGPLRAHRGMAAPRRAGPRRSRGGTEHGEPPVRRGRRAGAGPDGSGADPDWFSVTVTGVRPEAGGRVDLARRAQPGRLLAVSLALHAAVLAVSLLWPQGEPAAVEAAPTSLDVTAVAAILAPEPEGGSEVGFIGLPAPAGGAGADEPASEVPGSRGGPDAEAASGEGLRGEPPRKATGGEGWRGESARKEAPGGEGDANGEAPGATPASRTPDEPVLALTQPGALEGAPGAGGSSAGRDASSGGPWGWALGGSLAVAGLVGGRWRRALRVARARRAPWTWAGAVGLAGLLGRAVERAAILGIAPPEAAEARGALPGEVLDTLDDVAPGTLDAVALAAGEHAAIGRAESLRRAWRAVRTGGALLAGGAAVDGETLAREVAASTGAATVWLFERDTAPAGGLRALVLAVKGRPSRGPRAALDAALAAGAPGLPMAAIAVGFRGAWPLDEREESAEELPALAGA